MLSEGAKRFLDSSVGIWEMEGVRYAVFVNAAGGLGAKELDSGKPVGAGLPISGSKIGPLPEGFSPASGGK